MTNGMMWQVGQWNQDIISYVLINMSHWLTTASEILSK